MLAEHKASLSLTCIKMTTYLFTDVAEASVLPYTLKRLAQNWVKGFVAVTKLSCSIARDSKGSNVYLNRKSTFCIQNQPESICWSH